MVAGLFVGLMVVGLFVGLVVVTNVIARISFVAGFLCIAAKEDEESGIYEYKLSGASSNKLNKYTTHQL
ncbi:hypothetical protein ACHAWO_005776 [Cyclotella atomus]|uniref:Uncharacterized protein n=1 Tax=Cyclotella atomus TaxID=382360 RepID=A0ABD3PZ32_9STRA